MNVIITTFTNPFSFFCLAAEEGKNVDFLERPVVTGNVCNNRMELSDVTHGQYVAVLWKNNWTRGLVSMEKKFLIWLIDYGFYLRPDDKTVYVNLATPYKKYPTKVFEASIHGVAPVDKVLSDECEIKNQITDSWNSGSMEKAQSLIASASRVYFVPVALMETRFNDIVLGDLYLECEGTGIVNIIDEMELWPVFLQRNKEAYIENLSTFYTTRRKHRACLLKPAFVDSDLPTMNMETTYSDYSAICANSPELIVEDEYDRMSGDGSTVVDYGGRCPKDKSLYKLTPSEIEKYCNMYVTVCGREYNVLNILTNKTRDLNICQQYADHDLKRIGRASCRNRTLQNCDNAISPARQIPPNSYLFN